MAVFLITGCSKGLGLELATQLSAKSSVSRVFATARRLSPDLEILISHSNGKVKYVHLDVQNQDSAVAAAQEVAEDTGSIDVLINNAAIANWMTDGIEKMDDLVSTFQCNVASVQTVTATMLPLLRKGSLKKVFNMYAVFQSVGSVELAEKYKVMQVPANKVSKAALNMLTMQWALSFRDEGIAFILISPGWLRTDAGSSSADLSVQEGTQATLDIIENCGIESTGKFLNIHVPGWEENPGVNQYDGKELPW